MSTLQEIKAAIKSLSLEDRAELAQWFHGWGDDEWDRQLAGDVNSGRLDELLKDVDRAIESGDLRKLP